MRDKLTTIAFVSSDKVISPPLVTAREYVRWLETVYDEYTCNYELYLKAKFGDNEVLEKHPGTRIGQYFDNTFFSAGKYNSWYIQQESSMMKKLHTMKLAEYRDIAQVLSGKRRGMRLLRLYSVDQIELYIRTKIDKSFRISDKFMSPKKITLRKSDMKDIIIPETQQFKKSLLDERPIPMTVKDIEKQLGHKVSIVS